MIIIYREATGEVVDNLGTNSLYPEGLPDDMAWGDRDRSGLALFRLHDEQDAELVQAALTHQVLVIDGELVIGEPIATPDPEPASQSPAERIDQLTAKVQQQDQILQLLLLGGVKDDGTLDDPDLLDLPDDGSLDDLDLDLPDSGETLDDLEGL